MITKNVSKNIPASFAGWVFFILSAIFSSSLITIPLLGNSQNIFRGLVCDFESKEPIPYSTVLIKGSTSGKYTNSQGEFEIFVKKGDTIFISSVSYAPYQTIIREKETYDTIYLKRNEMTLKEAVVSKIDLALYKEIKAGFSDLKTNWSIAGSVGRQYVTFIPNKNPNKESFISKIIFSCRRYKKDSVGIRFHIFSVGNNQLPGEDLLEPEDYVIIGEIKESEITYDVKKYKINFPPTGIFIGIEYLGKYDPARTIDFSDSATDPQIYFTDKVRNGLTFTRTYSTTWSLEDVRRFSIGSDVEKQAYSKPPPTPAFGLSLLVHK